MAQTIILVPGKFKANEHGTSLADVSDIYDDINNKSLSETLDEIKDKEEEFGPYQSVAAAHSALAAKGLNKVGTTVGIISQSNMVVEYWYQGGTAQVNLVLKQSEVEQVKSINNIPLSGAGNIEVVQADFEDLANDKGSLKLADKAYVPNDFSGMGRVYLRKNMINASLHFADIISDLPSTETETLFGSCDEIVYETTNNRFLAVKHTNDGKKYYPNYLFTDSEVYSEPDDKHIYVCDANAKLYTYENGALEETTTLMDKNVLTQDMINKPNTIYIIQYDYDIVDMVNDTTTNNFTVDGEYYSYKPITIADNQTYRALNDCVFINYHNNTLIGSVLVTGYAEGQDYAIAKKSSAASGVPVSYYSPNGTINIPANCVLQFDGGSIKNGSLQGANTKIDGNYHDIFTNVSVSGTWLVPNIDSSMFTDIANDHLSDLVALSNSSIYNRIVIHPGNYNVSIKADAAGCAALTVPANTDLIINGTISLSNFTGTQGITYGYYVIRLRGDCINVSGNGTIKGDKLLDSKSTEYGHAIVAVNSSYITISGIKVQDCYGDGIYVNGCGKCYIDGIEVTNWHRNGISVINSEITVEITNSKLHDGGDTDPGAGIDIEPNANDTVKHVAIKNVDIYNTKDGIDVQATANNTSIGTVEIDAVHIHQTERNIATSYANPSNINNIVVDNSILEDADYDIYGYAIAMFAQNNIVKNTTIKSTSTISKGCVDFRHNSLLENCDIDAKIAYSDINRAVKCKFKSSAVNYTRLQNALFEQCEFDGTFAFYIEDSTIRGCTFKVNSTSYQASLKSTQTVKRGNNVVENNTFKVVNLTTENSITTMLVVETTHNVIRNNRFINANSVVGTSSGVIALSSDATNCYIEDNDFVDFAASKRKIVDNGASSTYAYHKLLSSGPTAGRPSLGDTWYNLQVLGFVYFDTDLKKPIYRTGSGWVDATGNAITQ